MIERLVSAHAVTLVDLARGGSIAHFGRTEDARDNLLARVDSAASTTIEDSPFSVSRREWLTPYNGGWQLLTPNGGDECWVDERFHPFHGDVSRQNWVVVTRAAGAMTIQTVVDDEFAVTRELVLDPGVARLVVSTTIENLSSQRVPAMVVEHLALAGGDDARVHAPSGSQWDLQASTPGRSLAVPWAEELGRPIPKGTSRVASLVAGNRGWIELRRAGLAVRIDWDPDELPYLWYWQERESPGFPFNGRADIVGLEPASAAYADGLSRAIERGQAWWLDPHESRSTSVNISFTV